MESKENLTPVDIRHKEFSSSFNGYRKDEVRDFLEQVSNLVGDLQNRSEKLTDPTTYHGPPNLDDIPQQPKPTEDLIGRTLILAEQTRDQIISEARQKAESIMRSAEKLTRKKIEEARHYLDQLEHQYIKIKNKKKRFLSQWRGELEGLLDKMNRETVLKPENEHEMDQRFENLIQLPDASEIEKNTSTEAGENESSGNSPGTEKPVPPQP